MHECRWDGCGELRGVNTGTWGSGVRFFVDVEMFDSIRLEIRGADERTWSDIFSSANFGPQEQQIKAHLLRWKSCVFICDSIDWMNTHTIPYQMANDPRKMRWKTIEWNLNIH